MVYVYLVYGLSFFTLWTIMWIYHMKLGKFFLARHLWMIGLFAMTHGMSDWTGMLVTMQKVRNPFVGILALGLLVASFFLLVQFGACGIAAKYNKRSLLLLPLLLLIPVAVLTALSSNTLLAGEILSRYLLGAPGALLTFYALRQQMPEIRKTGQPQLVRHLRLASAGFLMYALFTGLIVPEAPFFPADVFNYRTFTAVTGMHVEIFRAFSILVITYAMTRLLHSFEMDLERTLRMKTEELEEVVRTRTAQLNAVNEELRRHELQQKAILDNIPDMAWLKDRDGKFIAANEAVARSTGTKPESLTGKNDFDMWPNELAERYRKDDQEVMRTGVRKRVEEPFVDKNGNTLWIETVKTPITDERGEIVGTTGIGRDITGRRQMEEALKESEQRFRAVTENAMDGIITIDQESTVVLANPAVERIFGYRRDELEGRALTLLIPARLRPRHRAALREYVETGKRHLPWGAIELPGLHRDGREIPVEMSYGEYVREGRRFFTGIIRDITVRKEMESALRESERLRRLIMDAVPALISYVGSDLRYRFVNRQYETWWKRPSADFIGRHIKDILGEKRYEIVEGHIKDALLGQMVSYEWLVPREHDERFVQVAYVPHLTQNGTVLGFFTMINDITDLKRAEQSLRESEKRIELIIDTVPALISYVDRDLRYRFVNRQYEEWFGRPASEIIGRHVQEMLGESRFEEIKAFAERALAGEKVSYERSLVQRGRRYFLKIEYVPHFGENGATLGLFSLITDITDRKQNEESLQRLNEKLSSVLNSITEAYYVLDRNWKVVEINREAEKILGPATEVLGRVYWELFPQNIGSELDLEYHAAFREKRTVHFEAQSRINYHWYEVHGYPRADRLEVYFRDVSERKRLEEIVQHRAYHDHLTDLPNRLLFKDILQLEAAQARRSRKRLAVLFLDLDRFKYVNDTLGHDAGDELLKQVALRLRKSIRQSDTVGRAGGDEFTLLLSDIQGIDDITRTVRKIMDSFQQPCLIGGQELRSSASVGISIYPDDSREIDTLMKCADMAMYHAKEQGRNRYQFYDPLINTRTTESLAMEKSLRQALDRGELMVHYLPELDTRSREVVGAEALLRWADPKRGLLMPAEFLRLAETSGLIVPIGEWLLRTVARQIKEWRLAGYRPIPVTLNLSDRQFHQKHLAETTRQILEEAELEPRWLAFEIGERTAMKDVEFAVRHLQELAEVGVKLFLDDYGTGDLSLNQLKKLSFQKLKIDRSLIDRIVSDPDDRLVVQTMIALSHMMGIKAAAEGVETADQFELLREKDCDEVQGYIFSRPAPAGEFEKLLVLR